MSSQPVPSSLAHFVGIRYDLQLCVSVQVGSESAAGRVGYASIGFATVPVDELLDAMTGR